MAYFFDVCESPSLAVYLQESDRLVLFIAISLTCELKGLGRCLLTAETRAPLLLLCRCMGCSMLSVNLTKQGRKTQGLLT